MLAVICSIIFSFQAKCKHVEAVYDSLSYEIGSGSDLDSCKAASILARAEKEADENAECEVTGKLEEIIFDMNVVLFKD